METLLVTNILQKLGVNIAQTDLDEINLSLAQQQFAKKEYAKAIPNYEKFLTQNPTGEKFYQAQYELGESYYQTKNLTKAKLVLGKLLMLKMIIRKMLK
jgi:TolA-binding protein